MSQTACVRSPVLAVVTVLVAATTAALAADGANHPIPWTGPGDVRLVVTASPADRGERDGDARPARLVVDFEKVLADLGVRGRVEPASVRVVQVDPRTGRLMTYPNYRGETPFDVPCRFDHAEQRSYSHMYNLISDSQKGELIWVHRQRGRTPSTYAIMAGLVEAGEEPRVPARPMIGDIDVIYQRSGGLMSSMYHTRPGVADWDGDGRFDLLLGNILGHVFFHRNTGTASEPDFGAGRMLTADSKPIDVGYYAAPKVVDLDGDGDLDLACGCNGGTVKVFENVGTRTAPRLVARGPLQAEGKPIMSPPKPCPETPFMRKDYVPVPELVDWDGDGDLDLLLGGYVTGMVFVYENLRDARKGMPDLRARGTLQAGGKPIDVVWGAAPTAVDVDADGDLDLILGTLDHRLDTGEAKPWPSLFYYENTGTRTEPKLRRRPSPLGETIGTLTIPRPVDWDADGDLDLVVGVGCQVRLLRNVGGKTEMVLRAEPPLTAPWMPLVASGFAVPPVDWDADGDVDFLLSGERWARFLENVQDGNPPQFVIRGTVTAGGKVIEHEWPHGDDHSFSEPFDWDGDGDLDYLLGVSAGYVWYYENVGSPRQWRLARGKRFLLTDGKPVKVGKPADTPMTDFATHSGDRSDVAAGDYDGDGDNDLLVSSAYGRVWYFSNVGSNAEPRFAPGRVVQERPSRCVIAGLHWDDDGRRDAIASWSGHGMWVLRNTGPREAPHFTPLRRIDLPWIPYPHPYPIDWNRDGDVDLMIACSYSYVYFAERSYIRGGYVEGTIVRAEQRDAAAR